MEATEAEGHPGAGLLSESLCLNGGMQIPLLRKPSVAFCTKSFWAPTPAASIPINSLCFV